MWHIVDVIESRVDDMLDPGLLCGRDRTLGVLLFRFGCRCRVEAVGEEVRPDWIE